MPLFGSSRDSLLVKHFNKELISRWISVEIAFYKFALPETEMTIYNESSKKVYYNPVRFFALINKEDINVNDVDTGIDISQIVTFSFLRDDLKDLDIVMEEGDIIHFDEKYYEIDNTQSTQYWLGRNPDTLPITTEGRSLYNFGYNVAVKCQTHLTRVSNLNLVDVRYGLNTNKNSINIPRNL